MSLILAQFLGVIFSIFGVVIALRHKELILAVGEFANSRTLRLGVGAVEVTVGVFLVLVHPVWVWGYEVLITLTGWLILAEGLFYLCASERTTRTVITYFNRAGWYVACGLLLFILGLFLMSVGFGLI